VIKRVLWIGLGVALTAVVLSKAPKTLRLLLGSNSATESVVDRVMDFAADVRDAMREREDELRASVDGR
jgi:hypothetical protein